MRNFILLIIALTGVMLHSCTKDVADQTGKDILSQSTETLTFSEIEGTWELNEWIGSEEFEYDWKNAVRTPTFIINSSGGFSGFTIINVLWGSFEPGEEGFTISQKTLSTQIGLALDTAYLEAIEHAVFRYDPIYDRLLAYNDGELALVYTRPFSFSEISGTWTLTEWIGSENFEYDWTLAPRTPFFNVNANGNFSGSTLINPIISGSFEIKSNGLVIPQMLLGSLIYLDLDNMYISTLEHTIFRYNSILNRLEGYYDQRLTLIYLRS